MNGEDVKFNLNDIIYKNLWEDDEVCIGKVLAIGDDLMKEDDDDCDDIDFFGADDIDEDDDDYNPRVNEDGDDGQSNRSKNKYLKIALIPNGEKQIVHEKRIWPYDRFLQKGNIIKRQGDGSQLGMCVDTNRTVSLRVLHTNKVISNVSVNDLLPRKPLEMYDIIRSKYWVGAVKNVTKEIVVKTRDGSELILNEENLLKLNRIYEKREKHVFEPGFLYMYQLLMGNATQFANSYKRKITPEMGRILEERNSNIIVRIQSIQVLDVDVGWICGYDADGKVTTTMHTLKIPRDELSEFNLVNCPVENYLGAYIHYKVTTKDTIQRFKDWRIQLNGMATKICFPKKDATSSSDIVLKNAKIYGETSYGSEEEKENLEKQKSEEEKGKFSWSTTKITSLFPLNLKAGDIVPVEVILSNTTANVMWQDGKQENDLNSCELIPIRYVDDSEYFPGDYVMDIFAARDKHFYGCVKEFNHKDRIALVAWLRCNSTEPSETEVEVIKEEECSAYNIIKHPFSKFKSGTQVLRAHKTEQQDIQACVGTITEVQPPRGFWVKWQNEDEELMSPVQLFNYDAEIVEPDTSMPEENKIFSLRDFVEKPLEGLAQIIKQFSNYPTAKNGSFFLKLFEYGVCCQQFGKLFLKCLLIYADLFPLNWILFLIIFTSAEKQKSHIIYDALYQQPLPSNIGMTVESLSEMDNILIKADTNIKPKVVETAILENDQDTVEMDMIYCNCHKLCITFDESLAKYGHYNDRIETLVGEFKRQLKELLSPEYQFPKNYPVEIENLNSGILTFAGNVPTTHHYKDYHSHHYPTFGKSVRKEFINFEIALLSEIYIKCFTDRKDLYSVLIKGPKNTPYEDGLFLFDIHLPANYPYSPPNVFYVSFCAKKLNPNLFENGLVRLGLLGTMVVEETAMWIPKESNLYQLLVFIQELILIPEPYYLEPGCEKEVGTSQGRENSRLYNETVVLRTIDSMISMIKEPPQTFKEDILYHFNSVGSVLLTRYKNYLTLSDTSKPPDTKQIPEFPLLPCSKGFCIALTSSLNKLEQAINSIEFELKTKQ